MEIQDSNPATVPGYKVNLKYSYVHQLIGKEIPHEVIREILNSLEMEVTHEDENSLDIVVPPYRTDVQRPCDVVEDILRIYGYNNVEIPLTVNSSLTIKGETDRSNKLQNLISEQLVGAGFNEIMNNSLTKASYYQDGTFSAEHAVKVMNPLSEDLSVMRQTLLYGGLESLKRNINHKNPNLRFFEFGNCYRFNEANRRDNVVLSPYSEDYHLGLFICGKRVEGSWAHPDEDSSIYELKANVENIFMRLGLNLAQFKMQQIHDDVFVEAMSITSRSGKELSRLGIVRPEQTAKAEVQIPVYFADLNWTLIMKETKKNALSFQEISNYPKVSRDLALLVDKSVTFLQIEEVAYSSERNLLKRVELFDVYEGKNLPEGKKSYAVNFVLQDESKTLTDKQIEKIMNNLIRNLEQRLGASLR